MKVLIEPITRQKKYKNIDAILLSVKDYSVQSANYFTLEEIKQIKEDNPNLELFLNLNKNYSNDEIEKLKVLLQQIDNLAVNGIFFYDLAILQIHKELNLKTDLVWAATHMVNNYKTCNYYFSKGVNYALLSKEITIEEIKEIIKNTSILSIVEVVGLPSVAFSKRKLITNFYNDLGKKPKELIEVQEKITKDKFILKEDSNGTNFYLNKLVNGTALIKDLYDVGCAYILLREYGIEKNTFKELITDTKNYISNKCNDKNYITKYKKLGDFTNFFFKKTIYKVKKNG